MAFTPPLAGSARLHHDYNIGHNLFAFEGWLRGILNCRFLGISGWTERLETCLTTHHPQPPNTTSSSISCASSPLFLWRLNDVSRGARARKSCLFPLILLGRSRGGSLIMCIPLVSSALSVTAVQLEMAGRANKDLDVHQRSDRWYERLTGLKIWHGPWGMTVLNATPPSSPPSSRSRQEKGEK